MGESVLGECNPSAPECDPSASNCDLLPDELDPKPPEDVAKRHAALSMKEDTVARGPSGSQRAVTVGARRAGDTKCGHVEPLVGDDRRVAPVGVGRVGVLDGTRRWSRVGATGAALDPVRGGT